MQELVTTFPAVLESQNGSGLADSRRDYFDLFANNTWNMDERGFITRTKYSVATAAPTQRIDDVDTSMQDPADVPAGWETPTGGGLNLFAEFEELGSCGRETFCVA